MTHYRLLQTAGQARPNSLKQDKRGDRKMSAEEYRIEKDSMGEVKVPESAYYGAQTQRAVENFPVSGIGFPAKFIHALALVKYAAAAANEDLHLLDTKTADAIRKAATEIMEGKHDKEFVVDIFQT